ncbi:MAG TPA: DUF4190 domain-containing protein, partial [Candidatus Janibacter merdipullorum]|nr:DUF4190 domain-containing protein [Candidatus Janibacter merdipullorum]
QPYAPGPWTLRPSHGGATAALICGIIGLVAVPGLGIVAWIIGHLALKEIDAAPPGAWANREHANIGKILGIVSTVLYGLIFGFIILMYVGIIAFAIGME